MGKILEVNVNRYPLNGESRIHRQSGSSDSIAVGLEEIGKLPRLQQEAIQRLVQETKSTTQLVAFLDTKNGNIYFTNGDAPIVAIVDKKGQTKKNVQWL